MTGEELLLELTPLNEEESFYKSYNEARNDEARLKAFLEGVDTSYAIANRLIIPEISDGWLPVKMKESLYFDGEGSEHVIISKHNRYTPLFLHQHTFYELVYVLSGSCTQSIRQHELKLKEGTFLLLAPNVPHSIGVFDSSLVINILIRKQTFEEIFFSMLRGRNRIAEFFNASLYNSNVIPYLTIETEGDSFLKEFILGMFCEYLEKKPYYEEILDSETMVLFSKLLQQYEERISYPPSLMKKCRISFIDLISYIEGHYQTITLRSLAGHFAISEAYCSRLIRAQSGRTFSEIIQQIRFSHATSLLTGSSGTISEIAYSVGYENVEHFTRQFRKTYGMTPGQYRKSAEGNRVLKSTAEKTSQLS